MNQATGPTEKLPTWAELREMVLSNAEQWKEARRHLLETERIIKAGFMESRLQMQETDRRMQETDRQMQETGRQMQETDRRMQETDRKFDRLEESMKKSDEKYRELADQFTSTTGHITEGIMEPASVRIFQEAGYNINRYYRNLKRKNKQNQIEMEVDLLMLDDTLVIAVEVKTDCRKKDIDHFLRNMPKFKRLFPEYRDKEVLAAVAAINYDKDAACYAHEQGLLVISTTDGNIFTLEPSNPKTLKRF